MSTLAFTRSGSGDPLVLLHGIGMSRHVWDAVIPGLAEHFDVIAVDLPGFGDSAPVPSRIEATPAALAASVADLIDELGITTPHVAGNSLGGWVALELAAIRTVASVALLSPAGFWRGDTPLYCRISLRASRWLARYAARPLSRLVNYRLGRILVLGQTHARPGGLSADYARHAIRDLGTCSGFEDTLNATAARRYLSRPVAAPVTIAFGSHDILLLRRQSRHLDQLPAGFHVGELPHCGHVPMSDNPAAVTALITASAEGGILSPARPHPAQRSASA